MAVQYGTLVLFGIRDWNGWPQIGPIEGIPEGARAKLKLRARDLARLYIRHNGSTSVHYVESISGKEAGPWKVGPEIGRNICQPSKQNAIQMACQP